MRTIPLGAALAALLLATTACSQQGGGPPGDHMGGGPPRDGMGPREGMGPRGGMGPRVGSDSTPGWMMMDPAEREEHRRAMAAARTPDECRKLRDEHLQRMQQRARERGMGSMPMPMHDACEGMNP